MRVSLAELLGGILPSGSKHKVVSVLHAYFDETGTHGADRVLIAGWLGPLRAWEIAEKRWEQALGDLQSPPFHYSPMRAQTGEFELFPTWQADALTARLANVMAESDLLPITAGFVGNWDRAVSAGKDWNVRFPSPYHFAFELAVEQLNRQSDKTWAAEPIAVIFSQQSQYKPRALEVWDAHKSGGYWPHLHSLTYEERAGQPRLDMADMICWETVQCMGHEQDTTCWQRHPLLSRLLNITRPFVGGYHTEESFIEMMNRSPPHERLYLRSSH